MSKPHRKIMSQSGHYILNWNGKSGADSEKDDQRKRSPENTSHRKGWEALRSWRDKRPSKLCGLSYKRKTKHILRSFRGMGSPWGQRLWKGRLVPLSGRPSEMWHSRSGKHASSPQLTTCQKWRDNVGTDGIQSPKFNHEDPIIKISWPSNRILLDITPTPKPL